MTPLTPTDRQILRRYPASTRTALRHADAADARVMREAGKRPKPAQPKWRDEYLAYFGGRPSDDE